MSLWTAVSLSQVHPVTRSIKRAPNYQCGSFLKTQTSVSWLVRANSYLSRLGREVVKGSVTNAVMKGEAWSEFMVPWKREMPKLGAGSHSSVHCSFHFSGRCHNGQRRVLLLQIIVLLAALCARQPSWDLLSRKPHPSRLLSCKEHVGGIFCSREGFMSGHRCLLSKQLPRHGPKQLDLGI